MMTGSMQHISTKVTSFNIHLFFVNLTYSIILLLTIIRYSVIFFNFFYINSQYQVVDGTIRINFLLNSIMLKNTVSSITGSSNQSNPNEGKQLSPNISVTVDILETVRRINVPAVVVGSTVVVVSTMVVVLSLIHI